MTPELNEKRTKMAKKRSYQQLAIILLEPKSMKGPLIRFILFFILAGILVGTSLPFLPDNWAIYLSAIGVAIGLFSLVQGGYVVAYYRRANISYQLSKDGLYVRVREHEVKKVPWKSISNISVYLPEGRFSRYHCLIESTEGTVNLNLSHFEEKLIKLKSADHIAQAIIIFNNQRLKNLKKRVLGH